MTQIHIEHQRYLNQKVLKENHGLDDFFKNLFDEMHIEIIRLRRTIFKDGPELGEGQNRIEHYTNWYASNERTWIGIFNNALLRAYHEDVTMLQEYAVYNEDNRSKGRADFLVHWNKVGVEKPLHLLFEVKQYHETNQSKMTESGKFYLEGIQKQALSYMDAEDWYYKDKEVQSISLAFGCMRGQALIDEAKHYIEAAPDSHPYEDFISLYSEGHNGVWVYGKVYDPFNGKATH